MHPKIKYAIMVVHDAKSRLRGVLEAVQETCPHSKIIHSNWASSEWGSPFKARRLCLCCGLEEEARNSGWGDSDRDFPNLKSGGFHKVVSRDVIYRNRFPEVEPDTPQ